MQGSDTIAQIKSFGLDPQSKKEFEQFLKEAAEMPRRKLSHAATEGAKIALKKTEDILNASLDTYTMAFKDGNTWRKEDIIKNLVINLERGKNKSKRVAYIGISDWRVDLYSNFVEYGYTNPITGQYHVPTHFMRDGLTLTYEEVIERMLEDIRISLDSLKTI